MKFRITKAKTYRDFEKIYALDLLIFGAADGSMSSMDDMTGSDWWLVFDDNWNEVGYCGVIVYEDFAVHKRCGVIRQARGHGLQRRMLRTREDFARKAGCKSICTYVSVQNPHSANNLIKAGYRVYNPAWRWGGDEFLYIMKEFNP